MFGFRAPLLNLSSRGLPISILGLGVLALVPLLADAAIPWEAGIIFLGAKETPDYQADIDQNFLDLTKATPNSFLRLSVYREFPDRFVQFFVEPGSGRLHSWDPLFFKVPVPGIQVEGNLLVEPRGKTDVPILLSTDKLKRFLNGAFRNPESRRILIIYGHGLGYKGMQDAPLKELHSRLEESLPGRKGKPLDILWLDACFMASIDANYELRNLSSFFMGSEDAEFSAGAPFDSLQLLEDGPERTDRVTEEFAERFIESYSYLEEGRKRFAASSSSAMISVIDNDRLNALTEALANLAAAVGRLSDEQRNSLQKSSEKRKLDLPDSVDLGSYLRALAKNKFTSENVRAQAGKVLNLLELHRSGNTKTNSRIAVRPPKEDSLMVFGYEDWTRGNEGDSEVLDKIPPNLKPRAYVPGPHSKSWPSRTVRKRLYVTPFTVGLSEFNLFFADPGTRKPISSTQSYKRVRDFAVFNAKTSSNPLLFFGYTQGIGQKAERYSGFSILDPSLNATSLDYLDTEFAEKTHWAQQ